MSSPEISFIIPCYNSADFVETAISSLDGISLPHEVICIDDGSTDLTFQKLEELSKTRPQMVILRSLQNSGTAFSRNKGMNAAKGKWIQFLDSDDSIDLGRYQSIIKKLKNTNAEIVSFDAYLPSTNASPASAGYLNYYNRGMSENSGIGRQILIDQIRTWNFRPSACLYIFRRKLINRTGLSFSEGFLMEDNYFSFALFFEALVVYHVPTKAYVRSIREDSISFDSSQALSRRVGYLRAVSDIAVFLHERTLTQQESNILEVYLAKFIDQAGKVPPLPADSGAPLSILERSLIEHLGNGNKNIVTKLQRKLQMIWRRLFSAKSG